MGQIAHAGAAEFLLHGDAMQAQRPHFRPQIARERILVVDRGGARRDFGSRKCAHTVAQRCDLRVGIETKKTGRIAHPMIIARTGSRYRSAAQAFCLSWPDLFRPSP